MSKGVQRVPTIEKGRQRFLTHKDGSVYAKIAQIFESLECDDKYQVRKLRVGFYFGGKRSPREVIREL